ncbi:hypothetical protein STEG23_008965 [Scotinomys teguina]
MKKRRDASPPRGEDIELPATDGPCNVPKPGVFDLVNKAKWEAWNALGSLPKETARQNYVDLVSSLSPSSEASSQGKHGVDEKVQGSKDIMVTSEDGITKIVFNRPTKKNAITFQMYQDIILALKNASTDNSAITVFTGTGDYYCSGNDLSNFTSASGGMEEAASRGAVVLREFVNSFIDFPKPLVAVVNGPAVGISVTLLGLFDAVYASDKAIERSCNMPKLVLDFDNNAQRDRWKETSRQNHVDPVSILSSSSEASSQGKHGTNEKVQESKDIVVTSEDGITKIVFNRPTKKNAITLQMYQDIILALKNANTDNSAIIVFTGTGDYYCSGNDLSNLINATGEIQEVAIEVCNGNEIQVFMHMYMHMDVEP